MRMRRYQEMAGKRKEGLLVRARPLEQAEKISRTMVEVRVVDGGLLLDAALSRVVRQHTRLQGGDLPAAVGALFG